MVKLSESLVCKIFLWFWLGWHFVQLAQKTFMDKLHAKNIIKRQTRLKTKYWPPTSLAPSGLNTNDNHHHYAQSFLSVPRIICIPNIQWNIYQYFIIVTFYE